MIPAPSPHLCAIHGRCVICGGQSEQVIVATLADKQSRRLVFVCGVHAKFNAAEAVGGAS